MELGQQFAVHPRGWLHRDAWSVGLVAAALRRHWLFAILLGAGAVTRIVVAVAYRPALLYIDSLKYLYNAWPGTDPVGYKVPLRLILLFGNLETVAAVQHVLGLAMAVTIYVMVVRRSVPRWLAACAVVPVLLDAYQLQIEQIILPDVWFEALIVAGLAVLLWPARLTPWAAIAAGLLLGATATVREIGAILILPALIFVATAASGLLRKACLAVVLTAAFAVPIVLYAGVSYLSNGHFRLSRAAISQAYGRVALAADCAGLQLPSYERSLCPSDRQKSLLGMDGLDHSPGSPLVTYLAPPGMSKPAITSSFVRAVLRQQPVNVLGGVAGDALKLFALTRDTRPDDAPISRWQFQTRYPTYGGRAGANHLVRLITVNRDGLIVVGLNNSGATKGPYVYRTLSRSIATKAVVNEPLARLLRAYQLHGGYAPGPLYAFAALAGLLGSLSLAHRGMSHGQRELAHACLLTFTTAAALLLASDFFEFSWRYQLPALVTLPVAGALAIAMIAPRRPDAHCAEPSAPASPE